MTPTAISALRQRIQIAVEAGQIKQIVLAKGARIDPAQLSRFLKSGGGISDAQLALLQTSFDNLVEAPDPLPPDYALRLAKLLRDDKLVLFVGAGLSMQCSPVAPHDKGFPSWGELVEIVAARFDADDVNSADFRSAPTVFFDYVRALDDGEAKLKAALRGALDSSRVSVAPAHTVLARLPWAEVWTTNYDDILERAFHAKAVNGNADHSLIALYTRQKTPFVLHLHGTVDDPHTLGKRSYEQWPNNNEKLISHLRNTLLNGRTALFVGYGMGDPNLDSEFGWLRNVTDNNMRLYGFLRNVPNGLLRAYEASINLHAVSLSSNAEYVAAFRQIEREFRVLAGETNRSGAAAALTTATSTDVGPSDDVYERTQLATAMLRRWNDSGVAGLYLTDARYRADDLGVEDVFVEPGVTPWLVPSLQAFETTWSDENGEPVTWLGDDGKPVRWDVARDDADYMRRTAHLLGSRTPNTPPVAQPAVAALAARRLTVLLGDPGSGKSLLLRNIARTAAAAWQNAVASEASPLPVYLRLNAWESHSSANAPDVALLAVVWQELLTYADVPREQIHQWTSSDRPMLWLLDGLDEVRSQGARDGVREAVATLARTRPQDRFVVSARPSGYLTRFDGQWRELKLQPLNDAQQAAVLERWRDITATRDNLTLDVPGLTKDLKASRALSDLRGNPLMLTLAILFYRIKRRLPRDRWEYYEIVDTNLRDQLARQRALREQPVERERRAWADILGRIALSGMRAGLAEDGRGKVRFSRDEIESIVVDYHRAQQCTMREALAEAERFLRAADDLLGVIVAFAPDEYGFLHLTFLEYHAARRLLQMNLPAEKAEREQLMADAWDHPDWKEVWQLVVLGAVDTGHVDVFEALCDAAQSNGWPELDKWLARSELQQLEWVGLVGARVFNTAIWTRLEAWVVQQFVGDTVQKASVEIVLRDWSWPLSATLQSKLIAMLHDADVDDFVRGSAARALGSVATSQTVTDALVAFLHEPNVNRFARMRAAEALGHVAATPVATNALLAIVRDPTADRFVRRGAAQALGSVDATPAMSEVLLAILRDSEVDGSVRGGAAQALGPVAGRPAVTEALLTIMRDPKEPAAVRGTAAQSLGAVAGRPAVTEELLAVLGDAGLDGGLRGNAAKALGPVAATATVLEALLAFLQDPEVDGCSRRDAAEALGPAAATPALTAALLTFLRDPEVDCFLRSGAAQALGSVAATPTVTEALLTYLGDPTVDGFLRSSAALALGSVAAVPSVTPALLAILHDPAADAHVLSGVAQVLSTAAATPAVAEALLALLTDANEDDWVAWSAAQALSGVAFRLRRQAR